MNQFASYSLPLSLLFLQFITLIAQPISSFSLQHSINLKNTNLDSDFTLIGDAHIANSALNLTSSSWGSHGQVVYAKPFKFLDSKTSKIVSFSTDFTYTISTGAGDGLAFVIFPAGELSRVFNEGPFGISDRRFVAVEFDTRKDDNVGDLNGNHVGVDLGSFNSATTFDLSSVGLILNGGKPVRSWIDYEASSKRLEIRVSEFGTERPYKPLISHPIDLNKMWGDGEVLVAISSSSSNSSQITSLASWDFEIRVLSNSVHSMPLNPDVHQYKQPAQLKKSCFLTVLGAVIFATGCGTLVAFFGLFLWLILFGRHSIAVVTPELPLNPIEFKYEKVNVIVDNGSDESIQDQTHSFPQ